jgi:hypothetical protein
MSGQLHGVDLTAQSATAKFTPGQIHTDDDGNVWQYLQANGAKVANTLYSIHGDTGTSSTSYQIEDIIDLTVTPADTERVPACCPQFAITDNYYAWVFVGPGDFTGTSAEALTVDLPLYGHATAGAVSDTPSACILPGLSAVVAVASATTTLLHASHRLYAEDLA